MFNTNEIWAYPTDTSYGLGVRCDEPDTLMQLKNLKQRPDEKFFSLMVADLEMLKQYAHVPDEIYRDWFFETPRTAILKPTELLPKSIFWPSQAVAFRVCTIPEIAEHIDVPVTATSANISGKESIYTISELDDSFGSDVMVYNELGNLPVVPASQIWDFTKEKPSRVR